MVTPHLWNVIRARMKPSHNRTPHAKKLAPRQRCPYGWSLDASRGADVCDRGASLSRTITTRCPLVRATSSKSSLQKSPPARLSLLDAHMPAAREPSRFDQPRAHVIGAARLTLMDVPALQERRPSLTGVRGPRRLHTTSKPTLSHRSRQLRARLEPVRRLTCSPTQSAPCVLWQERTPV